jgi:predicted DsbA family dithiol-disulfide isomerase
MQPPATIALDIVSDVACPWCYVAKSYLWRALEARPDHPFRIAWHPFQLNPDLPPAGMDRAEYMAARFGSREQIVKVHAPLLEHAARSGAVFDLPAIRRTPNTRDAHRLIHWAGLQGRQSPMVERLMRAYWAEGRDIGDAATLTALAADAGLDPDLTARLLSSDADADEVSRREAHSRERGIAAVPTFVIADRYVVQGAQPTDMWLGVMDELQAAKDNTAQ